MALSVIQPSSHGPDQLVSAAELIGRSAEKAKVFKAIYTGQSPVKAVKDLMNKTGLSHVRVLRAGKLLAANDIVDQTKGKDGLTAYRKVAFYQNNRDKILRLAKNKQARDKVHTARNPAGAASKQGFKKAIKFEIRVPKAKINARSITIDEIENFAKAEKVRRPQGFTKISETDFKNGVGSVLGLRQKFKDWGGELRDLYDTNLRIGGRRRRVAIAFKGPGISGPLTPGKMGKNGDQIQRLLKCPADVFLVQYWREIEDSVMDQLQQLAELLSYQRNCRIYYGIIDGVDSTRLIKAYPSKFKVKHGS